MMGFLNYLISFSILAGIFALLTLGLNLQRGYTGLFNVGIAGFFAVGAYASAILTKAPSATFWGGFSWPLPLGILGGATLAGGIAFLIGLPTLRLREDYLAIATLGIAETLHLFFTNSRFTNGHRGLKGIPKPWEQLAAQSYYELLMLLLVVVVILVVFVLLEQIIASPWGRTLRAIREDEIVAQALGKNVFSFKMQALVLGAMLMGLAGGLYAHYISFVSPDLFNPMQFTFLIWVMLIVGGVGNNGGAILGAFLVWGIWTGTEFLPDLLKLVCTTSPAWQRFQEIYQAHQGPLRIIAISVLLELIILLRPAGLWGEKKTASVNEITEVPPEI